MNSIQIKNYKLKIKEYDNQRVVMFKDIDMAHKRPYGTASRNFRENKEHFIKNIDFYIISPEKYKSDEIRRIGFDSPRGG